MTATRLRITTDELKALVDAGHTVLLPEVVRPSEEVLQHYSADEVSRLDVPSVENPVVSVEYVRVEQVQCIMVDHPEHLYITDDLVPTHNTSNIVFLKSTDDSMLDTLQKMSGTTHRSYVDSKTVTQDKEKMLKGFSTEGKVSYTMATKEEPVIKYNDMAFISERQSIVFRAGDPPVWNRNETILPMSWRLFKDTIIHPGHDYSLQTIPTLSSALDFDVRMNQPNFSEMLDNRMRQAIRAGQAKEIYKEAYGLDDFGVERLDPDVYSDEVMSLIDSISWEELGINPDEAAEVTDPGAFESPDGMYMSDEMFEVNTDVVQEVATRSEVDKKRKELRFAGRTVSMEMLVGIDDTPVYALEQTIVRAFQASRRQLERDSAHFTMRNGDLYSADGRTVYISHTDESEDLRILNDSSKDPGSRVFAEDGVEGQDEAAQLGSFALHGEFLQYLAGLSSWSDLGQGHFERAVERLMREAETSSLV